MAVQYKDYYQSLGVSRNASDDEIRKAFRKLAREYHPDVAKDKAKAEDKFKEINEAYEVLGDPSKRSKYDQLGSNWKQGAEFRPPPGWEGFRPSGGGRYRSAPEGFEFRGTGFSDFFEQVFGSMGGAQGRSGGVDFEEEELSERGSDVEADLMVTLEEVSKGSIRSVTLRRKIMCQTCFGVGQVNGRVCPECRGEGAVERSNTYKVKIPAGVQEGQRLRVSGQGEPGIGGAEPGDLYLRVRIAKHPDFRVGQNTLFVDVEVAPWEAVLGANVTIPTLDGRIDIKVPAGTQNGAKLRVRGRGLQNREGTKGDLIVIVKIQVPSKISDTEKAAWEALARQSSFKPRE
ncbi:MAG: DnaJ C-terminal domain-containing protein [Verrucomicrobiota bacterium]|nr:DnaJ C-terminal domain-containing protein [Verrucomicrobiota bacterium]